MKKQSHRVLISRLSFPGAVMAMTMAFSFPACAEFILNSAIVEFNSAGQAQQDIEIISRSQDSDYIESETYEIIHPGAADERRVRVEDPAQGGILVTPDKMIVPANGRRVLRFVLLRDLDEHEHIYRVAVKPVIKGVKNTSPVGLKILVGYEALVIIRPEVIRPSFIFRREGKTLHVMNTGNVSIILQSGRQCPVGVDGAQCKTTPAARIYAGAQTQVELPLAAPLAYTVWDGIKTQEYRIQ